VKESILFLLAIAGLTGLIVMAGAAIQQPGRVVEHSGIVLKNGGAEALADPATGALEVKQPDGSNIRFGGVEDLELPAWMPRYPVGKAMNAFRMQNRSGGGSVGFLVNESTSVLCRTVTAEWKKAGIEVRQLTGARVDGCMLLAEIVGMKVTAVVSIGAAAQGSTFNVTYTKK